MSVDEYNTLSKDFEFPWHCPSHVSTANELPLANSSFTSESTMNVSMMSHFHYLAQQYVPLPAGVLMPRVL